MNNYVQKGDVLEVTVASPAVPTTGVPCRFGTLCGVAALTEGEGGVSAASKTMVNFGGGVYDLNVTSSGAVAIGDELWFHDANPPVISNSSTTGYSFGVALGIIASGAAVIPVLHVPRHGLGTTPADTTVTTAKLVADNVTAAKLTATLRTGFIPIDLFSAHVIGANAIAAQVGAASDPLLKRFNGATDIAASLSWESASVIEIQFPTIPYPPDLDDTADVDVHLLAKMLAGSVNTPVLTVKAFEGQGGADIGAATAALSTTMQDLKVALATAGISAHPNCLSIGVTPGAHNTASNDVRLYGAWLEYTRK